jgi:hypothetical protein
MQLKRFWSRRKNERKNKRHCEEGVSPTALALAGGARENLSVLDEFTLECLGILVATTIHAEAVMRTQGDSHPKRVDEILSGSHRLLLEFLLPALILVKDMLGRRTK